MIRHSGSPDREAGGPGAYLSGALFPRRDAMIESAEYLRRAVEMDARAQRAQDPTARDEFARAARAWRDLERRARARERREGH